MDCKAIGTTIVPLLWRIAPGKPVSTTPGTLLRFGIDESGRLLTYSAEERDEITHELDAAKITYKLLAEDQPDTAHLALLQGKVNSRSDALAALEALGKGETPAIPELRLKAIEAAAADLDARLTTVEEKPVALETAR